MPSYRFTWDHFEHSTVLALAEAIGFEASRHGDARAFLAERVKRPNERFVREQRDVLVHHWPSASLLDCEALFGHWALGGERPVHIALDARTECDPNAVAERIWTRDLGDRARTELVERSYTPLARAIYPERRDYWTAIDDALHELRYPDDSTRRVRAVPIFEPTPDQQLTPGPHHDLARLMAETLERGRALLGLDAPLAYEGELKWTERLVKGWYAMAYWDPETPHGHGKIRVNVLLDSPDISEETMCYLLWHEYLHLYLKALHTKTFRELERQWPTAVEGDRELFNLNERFGVQYW